MIVHVTTNYSCNKHCEYCYLGSLKNDPTIISLNIINKRLTELKNRYHSIERIDCYGGEPTVLDTDYFASILNTCKLYADLVTWVTNLTDPYKAEEIFKITGCEYATSLNKERGDDHLLEKMSLMEFPPTNIIQVATPDLMRTSPKDILEYASLFHINYLGFVQYFASTANDFIYDIKQPNKQYAYFLINIFMEYLSNDYPFKLEALSDISLIYRGKYTPWMDEAIFIMPNGEYASVIYDKKDNGREHFHIWKDLDEFDCTVRTEREYFSNKSECKNCKFFGHCYAEHLREWDPDDDCCGNYKVLEYIEKVGLFQ